MKVNSANKILVISAIGLGAVTLAYHFIPENSASNISILPEAYAKEGIRIPAPVKSIKESVGTQTAVFAGGCFWGVEGVFERVAGVKSVESGYSGGSKSDANYRFVSAGRTRHAESVRIRYDPNKVSYNKLLHIFFSVTHDPTQLNRQGPDKGPHYRTAIFPANMAQLAAARSYIEQLKNAKIWKRPIVTKIEKFSFYRAENYHQDYMRKNPNDAYIRAWDKPKIANLKRLFPRNLK